MEELRKDGADTADDRDALPDHVRRLKEAALNPTDGEEIFRNAPYLTSCEVCLKPVCDSPHQRWFLPHDLSCCICETCYHDFREAFKWKEIDGWDTDWDMERNWHRVR